MRLVGEVQQRVSLGFDLIGTLVVLLKSRLQVGAFIVPRDGASGNCSGPRNVASFEQWQWSYPSLVLCHCADGLMIP